MEVATSRARTASDGGSLWRSPRRGGRKEDQEAWIFPASAQGCAAGDQNLPFQRRVVTMDTDVAKMFEELSPQDSPFFPRKQE